MADYTRAVPFSGRNGRCATGFLDEVVATKTERQLEFHLWSEGVAPSGPIETEFRRRHGHKKHKNRESRTFGAIQASEGFASPVNELRLSARIGRLVKGKARPLDAPREPGPASTKRKFQRGQRSRLTVKANRPATVFLAKCCERETPLNPCR